MISLAGKKDVQKDAKEKTPQGWGVPSEEFSARGGHLSVPSPNGKKKPKK